ncbi:unnamed protein product, partial [Linum tenue]
MLLVFHTCHMCSRLVVTLLAPCHRPHVTSSPTYARDALVAS